MESADTVLRADGLPQSGQSGPVKEEDSGPRGAGAASSGKLALESGSRSIRLFMIVNS
jgi:hypothetical protein